MARNEGERDWNTITFHPQEVDEYNLPVELGHIKNSLGVRPVYHEYNCGACGKSTTGRLLCDVKRRTDGARILWCVCACPQREPTVMIEKQEGTMQLPPIRHFHADPNWPKELADLYEEAAKSFGAGAFTASAMVCRKLLMATACKEGDDDGKKFVEYVQFITDKVLQFPRAKAAIDKIRDIGNDANHEIAFVTQSDAARGLQIVTYMLNTIYALPVA